MQLEKKVKKEFCVAGRPGPYWTLVSSASLWKISVLSKAPVNLSLPVHAGLVVQHMAQLDREGLIGAVQLVIALGHVALAGGADGHAALVSSAQALELVVGEDQVLVLGVGGVGIIRGDEAERLLGLGHGSLEGRVSMMLSNLTKDMVCLVRLVR